MIRRQKIDRECSRALGRWIWQWVDLAAGFSGRIL